VESLGFFINIILS